MAKKKENIDYEALAQKWLEMHPNFDSVWMTNDGQYFVQRSYAVDHNLARVRGDVKEVKRSKAPSKASKEDK